MKRSFGVEISLTVQRKASQFLILICCFCWCFEAWSFNQGDWANFLHEKIFPRNLVRFLLEDLLQCRQKKSFHMICWCYQMMKVSIWCDYSKKKVKPISPGETLLVLFASDWCDIKVGDGEVSEVLRTWASSTIYVESAENWVNLSHKKDMKQSIETFDKSTSWNKGKEENVRMINIGSKGENYLFDSKNDAKLMHKT